MKKLTALMIMTLIILNVACIVYGFDEVSTGNSRLFYSKGYSDNAPLKVLNVWTSGTPAVDNLVTIYNWTDDDSQKWNIVKNNDISGINPDSYRVVSKGNNVLALNYRQDTTGCTLYYFGPQNYYQDYPIGFNSVAGGGYTIWLYYRNTLYLGNTGITNGSQCFWKTYDSSSGISVNDVWVMFV